MYGSCGRIEQSVNNTVIKSNKRKCNNLSIQEQFSLQKIAYNITNKFKIIKIPKPLELFNKSYSMEKIDDNFPYYAQESKNNELFIKELIIFYKEFIKEGYYPYDYECFMQKDGKIFILDFDKFIKIDKINKLNQELLLVGAFIPENFKQAYLGDPKVQ